MSGFSDDCQWWWDGQAWIATSQVVIPDLLPSQRAKELEPRVQRYRVLDNVNFYGGFAGPFTDSLGSVLWIPWLFFYRRAFRAYRELLLERFRTASDYLLGPYEPVLAAEAGIFTELLIGVVWGGYGVVVTANHVLVLANDKAIGHPRRVLMAAHPSEVYMQVHQGGILGAYPTILVNLGGQTWPIRGMHSILKAEPVLNAWRAAASRLADSSVPSFSAT